jgi:hypothetical protein
MMASGSNSAIFLSWGMKSVVVACGKSNRRNSMPCAAVPYASSVSAVSSPKTVSAASIARRRSPCPASRSSMSGTRSSMEKYVRKIVRNPDAVTALWPFSTNMGTPMRSHSSAA